MADNLWFSVLGPVQALHGGVEVELGSPQQRTVLAALLLSEGAQVSMGELGEVLWGDLLPARGHAVIRTYVSRLRQLLAPGHGVSTSLIRTVGGGYVMTPPADGVDLVVFRRKVTAAEQARNVDDLPAAAALLGEALALWRGEALAGLIGAYADTERAQLEIMRLNTIAAYLTTQLELGAHAVVVPELTSLVDRHPLDERFREMLMLAHYGSGQQAAALADYCAAQTLLADELGVDPGPALQALHERILRADPELLVVHSPRTGTTVAARVPARSPEVVAQLPPRLTVFAGRDSELARVNALVGEHDEGPGAVVVSGMAGVGKTAFAVHWAHQLANRFPDGQLYLNLRGFDPTAQPMTAADAVRSVLELLGVAPQSIPESLDAMAALYRGSVADRRILLLLDNARHATQVRPLLPGTTGCLVIVTSRSQLASLLVIDGAQSITLDVLTTTGAQDLLTRRLGVRRTTAEPDAVGEIIQRSARLPLALAIVAAHCAMRPAFTLAAIAAALRVSSGGLDTFSAKDHDSSAELRDVFSWSYRSVTPDAGRVFRLMAMHPGSAITTAAVASLAGLDLSTTDTLLVELTSANLLTEHDPGRRYHCHDLLRTYAGELTENVDTPAERAAAPRRLLDHYVHTAHAAVVLFTPFRGLPVVPAPAPHPGAVVDVSLDEDSVLRWFNDERQSLVAMSEYASANGFDPHVWQLAWAMDTYLYRSGHWQDALVVHTRALEAAQRLADPVLQAKAHMFLGAVHTKLGQAGDATRHLTQALTIYQSEGQLFGQAGCYLCLGIVASAEGRSQECIDHYQRSLAICGQLGEEVVYAAALSNLGREHGIIGDHETALALNHEALTRWTELGDRHSQANCRDNLGYSYHHLGQHEKAAENYQNAIDTFRELRDYPSEATSLDRLGDAREAVGDDAGAHVAWSQALAIFESNCAIGTEDLRLKLERSAGRHLLADTATYGER